MLRDELSFHGVMFYNLGMNVRVFVIFIGNIYLSNTGFRICVKRSNDNVKQNSILPCATENTVPFKAFFTNMNGITECDLDEWNLLCTTVCKQVTYTHKNWVKKISSYLTFKTCTFEHRGRPTVEAFLDM